MSGIVTPFDMKYVPKRWGYEIWITNNNLYCGKKLFIRHGKFCSYHWHEIKDEVLYIESGEIWMNYSGPKDRIEYVHLFPGDAFHVTPGMKHQMQATKDTMILEFSTQHFDEDSYRETIDLVIDHFTTELETMR